MPNNIEVSVETKLRAVEIADRTISQPYRTLPNGGSAPADKDMKELFRRADAIIEYATGVEATDTKSLISKLRSALCEEKC